MVTTGAGSVVRTTLEPHEACGHCARMKLQIIVEGFN
jgi:hypothetical protein